MAISADMVRFYALMRVHCRFMCRLIFGCLIVGLVLIGCQGPQKAQDNPVNVPSPTTPAEKSFEHIRSGIYQINAAMDSIEIALKEAKATAATSADLKQSLEDIQVSIDSAGDGLAEEAAQEPDKSSLLSASETRRKKLINLTNDALHDLRDARGIVDSLAGDSDQGPLEAVGLKIDVAMDDLRGALEALGGKEELEG